MRPARTGLGVPESAVGGISLTAAFVLATVVQMVLGELAPKNLAARWEEDHETVAGLVVDRLGRFPTVGDRLTVVLPDGGRAALDVHSLDRHVPKRVRLERLGDAAPDRSGDSPKEGTA